MQGGAHHCGMRIADCGMTGAVRRSERARKPTQQVGPFQQPARAARAGGRVHRLDGGATGGHGAGRLRTQPRRFVFLGAGPGHGFWARRRPLAREGYDGCNVRSAGSGETEVTEQRPGECTPRDPLPSNIGTSGIPEVGDRADGAPAPRRGPSAPRPLPTDLHPPARPRDADHSSRLAQGGVNCRNWQRPLSHTWSEA
jgi:hypothetical protein